jgi:hypothetical protein
VLAESPDVNEIARAVTTYVARRIVERELALAGGGSSDGEVRPAARRRWRMLGIFVLGLLIGAAAVLAAAWLAVTRI